MFRESKMWLKIIGRCGLLLLLLSPSLISAQTPPCRQPNSANGRGPKKSRPNWLNFRFDSCRTGYNPYETVLSPSTVGSLELKWKYLTGFMIDSSPAVVNGTVYIESSDGNVYAVDAVTGVLRWMYALGAYNSSPAVAGDVVYVSSGNGMNALDAKTGSLLWNTFVTYSINQSSPVVVDGLVYVGSDTVDQMNALNAETGELVWRYPTFGGVDSSPAVVNGVVYFATFDFFSANYFYALNARTGERIWEVPSSAPSISSPAVTNGLMYVGVEEDTNLYSLDVDTGAVVWSRNNPFGQYVDSSPAVAEGIVYFAAEGSYLAAVDANTGKLVWQSVAGCGSLSSPTVANGVVYIGCIDHNVYALDAAKGKVLWKYSTGNIVNSSPAVINGMLYVGSQDYYVYAFGLPDGQTPSTTYSH